MKFLQRTILIVLTLFTVYTSYAQQDSAARFKVFGACGQCRQRIEKSLKIKGVSTAKWDVATQMLSVGYDPSVISLHDLHKKMADIGHDTELEKARDEVYKALPECCLYRDLQEEEMGGHETHDEHSIRGIVLSEDNKGNFIPLPGATIKWLHNQTGTQTDKHGVFAIPVGDTGSRLVISYTGYEPDTLTVTDGQDLQIVLASNGKLSEVKVIARQKTTYINAYSPFRVANITSKELLKAACCNLSESFETNASVDVSYSDAVTGAKQIQLLGLSGNYTQLTVENLPGPRGLATPLGLNSIAGPWIEGIQLNKGTGSVVNGYESIAGQINVELKKPETAERVYANGYVNTMGKTDLNLSLAHRFNNKWSTALLLHDDFLFNKVDMNMDHFRDLPTGNQFSVVNRWKFDNAKGLMLQFGAKAMADDKTGGEMDFEKEHKLTNHHYGLGIKTNRYEGFAKIGYVFPEKKYQSVGLQLSAFRHDQESYFGLTSYNAKQNNFYSNLIYQDVIGNTRHKYKTGISLTADNYDEVYRSTNYKRKEMVAGAFFEYTYNISEEFDVVAGIRADHNSLFGWFATPRLNVRYEPVKGTTMRASIGKGMRTANIFAENMSALVSARTVSVMETINGGAYGLKPEIAWNKGISVDQKLKLFERDATVSVDFFRNDFTDQVIADLEDVRLLTFYNLRGKSFSNSLQTELSMTPVKSFDVRLAYRWFDVKATYSDKLLSKPFTAAHRAFANLAYDLQGWKLDYTVNFVGEKRIPSTAANPALYQMPVESPSYVTMNAQVSKALGKSKALDLYIGGENLTNYFQKNAILAADQPFSTYFDASMIWGPVSGRLIYGGVRYTIK